MAILGGIVLSILIILVCISVVGRSANTIAHSEAIESVVPWLSDALISTGLGPLPGDFEIVEAGIAFAIFAFLPLCQLKSGHATVDVFTSLLPTRLNTWLKAFWELCLTIAILLISWRLGVGLLDKIKTGETTLLLTFPLWWAYAASLIAACSASIVAIYCSFAIISEAVTGESLLATEEGSAP